MVIDSKFRPRPPFINPPKPPENPPVAEKKPVNSKTSKEYLNFLALVLDESGSMKRVQDQMISGFNEYIDERRKEVEEGNRINFWFTKFSTNVRIVHEGLNPKEIPDLDLEHYKPLGNTSLYDAVGHTILSMDKALKEASHACDKCKAPVKPRVFVVIMTDGEENSSSDFTCNQIKQMISEREAEGNWTFLYIGANQDVWRASRAMGIGGSNAISYAAAAPKGAMSALNRVQANMIQSESLQSLDTFKGKEKLN